MSVYDPSVPTGVVNLDQDYKNIQKNFSQANTSFGVDHVPFATTPNNGYHTNIHQIPLGADPAQITGINQLYSKVVSGDTQLFARTGGGGISQLTGNRANLRGWQYIGGVLLQWGSKAIATGFNNQPVPVVFTDNGGINFSGTPYHIQLTFINTNAGSTSATAEISLRDSTLTNAGFTAQSNQNVAGSYPGFFWLCIGPI